MKKILLAAVLGALAATSFAQGKDLKVAIDPTYEPFTYKVDGKPAGFDVDIANALCEQIKRKCVFVEQGWDSMIPGLQAKKYDVIISSMSITDERMKEVDFTDKYYNTPSRIVLKKTVKFTDVASIKGKKIGVLKGSTQEKYAMGELKTAGVVVNSYEAQDQVYLDYTGGGLYAASQVQEHAAMLAEQVLGNPHSVNPSSMETTRRVEQARAAVLDYFGGTGDYTAIFTLNA